MLRRGLGLALLTLLAGSPALAAGTGEITVGAHADFADAPRGDDAWWLGGWASVGLNDTFSLLATGSTASHALPQPEPQDPASFRVTSVAGGLRYDLDILRVAPFLGLQLGAISERREGGEAAWNSQVVISVGVDWVLWRQASVGVAAHWNQPLLSEEGGFFRAGPRLAWRWP